MSIRRRLTTILDQLDYDFSDFSLQSLAAWLSARRRRQIEFVGRTMPPNLYGAWIRGEFRDYIFYDQNTAPVHQLHIKLHELSHILCNHENEILSQNRIAILLRKDSTELAQEGTLRSKFTDHNEQEAEVMASLLIERIMQGNRRSQMLTPVYCISGVGNYWRFMDQ